MIKQNIMKKSRWRRNVHLPLMKAWIYCTSAIFTLQANISLLANAESCTMCQGTDEIPNPNGVALWYDSTTCVHLAIDAIFTPDSALVCKTYYQFIGFMNCGCEAPPPTSSSSFECNLCSNGRSTSTPNNIFDDITNSTCKQAETYLKNYEQNRESCASFQESAVDKCGCDGNISSSPSSEPTIVKSSMPSLRPSEAPTKITTPNPTLKPTTHPTVQPTKKTSEQPSQYPSYNPSLHPTYIATISPSKTPSIQPTMSSSNPPSILTLNTIAPSNSVSMNPTIIQSTPPSIRKSNKPSSMPSFFIGSLSPSSTRTSSIHPTGMNSNVPSNESTMKITSSPTFSPSLSPSTERDDIDCSNIELGTIPTFTADTKSVSTNFSLDVIMMDTSTVESIGLNLGQTLSTIITLFATGCDDNGNKSLRLLQAIEDEYKIDWVQFYNIEQDTNEFCNEGTSIPSNHKCEVIFGDIKIYYTLNEDESSPAHNNTDQQIKIKQRINTLLEQYHNKVAENNQYISSIAIHENEDSNISAIVQSDKNFISKPEFYLSAGIVGGTLVIALIIVMIVHKTNLSSIKNKYGILPSSHARSDRFVPVYSSNVDNNTVIPDANKSRSIEEEASQESGFIFFESQDGFEVQRRRNSYRGGGRGRGNHTLQLNDDEGTEFKVSNSFEGKTLDEWIESIERGDRNGSRHKNQAFGRSVDDDLRGMMTSSLLDLDSESESDVFENIDNNSELSF